MRAAASSAAVLTQGRWRSSSTGVEGGGRTAVYISTLGSQWQKHRVCGAQDARCKMQSRSVSINGLRSASRRGHQRQRPRTGHASARGRMHDTSPGDRIGDVVVRHVQAGGRETLVPITVPLRCPRLSSCGPISTTLGPVRLLVYQNLHGPRTTSRKPCAPPRRPGGTQQPCRAARAPGPAMFGRVAVVAEPVQVQAIAIHCDAPQSVAFSQSTVAGSLQRRCRQPAHSSTAAHQPAQRCKAAVAACPRLGCPSLCGVCARSRTPSAHAALKASSMWSTESARHPITRAR